MPIGRECLFEPAIWSPPCKWTWRHPFFFFLPESPPHLRRVHSKAKPQILSYCLCPPLCGPDPVPLPGKKAASERHSCAVLCSWVSCSAYKDIMHLTRAKLADTVLWEPGPVYPSAQKQEVSKGTRWLKLHCKWQVWFRWSLREIARRYSKIVSRILYWVVTNKKEHFESAMGLD